MSHVLFSSPFPPFVQLLLAVDSFTRSTLYKKKTVAGCSVSSFVGVLLLEFHAKIDVIFMYLSTGISVPRVGAFQSVLYCAFVTVVAMMSMDSLECCLRTELWAVFRSRQIGGLTCLFQVSVDTQLIARKLLLLGCVVQSTGTLYQTIRSHQTFLLIVFGNS